jgi:hypothetical protein
MIILSFSPFPNKTEEREHTHFSSSAAVVVSTTTVGPASKERSDFQGRDRCTFDSIAPLAFAV